MSATKGDDWFKNELVDFLLGLYHRRLIGVSNIWLISVENLHIEFVRYLNASTSKEAFVRAKFREQCKNVDIVNLLKRENFIKTETDSQLHINSELLLKYRKEILDDFIAKQQIWEDDDDKNVGSTTSSIVEAIDVSVEATPLVYQGNRSQDRIKFSMSYKSCFICQRDYKTDDVFEAHVHEHSEKTNFRMLNYYENEPAALKLSYRICDKTRNFRFNIQTDCMGIVVEHIIFVLPDYMYFVHKQKLPYDLPMNIVKNFDLKRHIFRQVEQPIVIIFHQKNTPHIQRIEQHHYVPWHKNEKKQECNENLYLPQLRNEKFVSTDLLKLYLPDNELRDVIYKKKPLNKLRKRCPKFNDYVERDFQFTIENYCGAMKTLLHLDDVRTMKRYTHLEQHNVNLRGNKNSYVWRFNGEVESGLLGPLDEVILRPSRSNDHEETRTSTMARWQMMLCNTQSVTNNNESAQNPIFAGVIQKFYHGTVMFRCSNLKSGIKYTMLFRPVRHQLRYQFRAIELLGNIEKTIMKRLLFPEFGNDECNAEDELTEKLNALTIVDNQKLKHDEEQLLAVQRILNGAGNAAPYVIFGPPGTGKTATIAAAIRELYKRQPSAKILVMSGSNFACDEITSRLIQLLDKPNKEAKAIVRICAQSYLDQVIDPDNLVLQYSNVQNNKHFIPSVKQMHEYRILVCTLNVAGKLALGGFGRNSNKEAIYTHIFIDESQSSTEAEALMGIMCTLDVKTKLIIAGDPKQLGTFVGSKYSEHYGLGYSLMERLMALPAYKVDPTTGVYNQNIMIRLRNNYRSHPEIVANFNELYYDNKLIAKAPTAQISMGMKWHLMQNPEYPIIFHSVFGTMTKSDYCYSLCNADEINVIIDYIHELLCFGINGKPIAQTDIGIISPYKEQYNVLREALYYRTWYEITVGTVEAFQGLEKQIIFVTFVRTTKENMMVIKRNEKAKESKTIERTQKNLGFLNNGRRINTIISRAKSLMILVGDPKLLIKSPPLCKIMEKCKKAGAMRGEEFTIPASEPESETIEQDNKQKQ